MNIDEMQKIVDYCFIRCGEGNCALCELDNIENCEGKFLLELFDVIDIKILEKNNINRIITEIQDMYGRLDSYESLTLLEYTVAELLTSNRYKITKKLNYDEILEKTLNI